MLQGVCVDPGQSAVLEPGKRYYLFPDGSHHFYVSKFPNQDAHMGCFQTLHFQIVEKEEWPQEPAELPIGLDPKKIYRAQLIWRKPGYKFVELRDYYIRPKKTHVDFYKDISLKECCGCFPLHWFTDFEETSIAKNETKIIDLETKFNKNDPISLKNETQMENYEQLSLFDF